MERYEGGLDASLVFRDSESRCYPPVVSTGRGERGAANAPWRVCCDCTYPMRRLGHSVGSFSLPPHLHSLTIEPSSIEFADDGVHHSARDPTTARAGPTSTRPLTNGRKSSTLQREPAPPSFHHVLPPSLFPQKRTNDPWSRPILPLSYLVPATAPSGALGFSGFLWVLKPIDSGNMSLVVPPNVVSPQIRTPPKSTTLPSTSQNPDLPSTLLWVTRA